MFQRVAAQLIIAVQHVIVVVLLTMVLIMGTTIVLQAGGIKSLLV